MAAIRYGARAPEQQRNREVEATTAKIWSTAVTVWWETDLDVIRAVLPPPLEPQRAARAHPLRDRQHGHRHPGVRRRLVRRARPARKRRGRVRAVHADDDRAGDGRRARDLRRAEEDRRRSRSTSTATSCTPTSSAWASRSPRCAARSATPIDIPPRDKVDFYFKCSPSPDGKGFDTEPALVHCRRHEEARDGRAIDGTLELFESPLDPIVDIPVGHDRRRCSSREVTTTQDGEVVERVPADWLLPYVHQRYDDLSVLGKKD